MTMGHGSPKMKPFPSLPQGLEHKETEGEGEGSRPPPFIELASLYTVPLSDVSGLSRLTKLTTSKGAGTADSSRKFSNQPRPFKSNRIGRPIRILIESRSFAGP